MSNTLEGIAQDLKNTDKKVQLIYAFNGSGKTRLSKEFTKLVSPSATSEEELTRNRILYYNAFTEDLFSWDNDLENDIEPKLKIQPNSFTNWILQDQGQDQNIMTNFQRYTHERLTPHFNEEYLKDEDDPNSKVEAFSEVSFSFESGDNESSENIKISKGEESNFIWSIFYSLIEEVINVLNIPELGDRDTNQFDNLEYIFIDDPVSSLDENHLIELAVDVSQLIKNSTSNIKFVITTHNPLFYNVLHNELNTPYRPTGYRPRDFKKYRLEKFENGFYELIEQPNDSPFSYHLFLKEELEKAIDEGQIHKYHFNFLRNILEKTSTFLGYSKWGDLLEPIEGDRDAYESRIINFSSHSKHSSDEVIGLTDSDKNVLTNLVNQITQIYRFKTTSDS